MSKKEGLFIGILLILTGILYINTLSPSVMIKGDDELIAGYPFKNFEKESILKEHQFPLWNPYIFGGLPFVDAIHGDIFYWTAWLRLVLPIHTTMVLHYIVQIILAGFFTYLFLKSLGLRKKIAAIGGIAYAFTGWIVSMTFAGHSAKVTVASFLPFVLYFLNIGIENKKIVYFLLAGLGIGLGLLVPHVQLVYYLLMISFLFTIWKLFFLWKDEKTFKEVLKLFVFFWIAVGVGFLISAVQILPGYSYIPFSPRAGAGRGYEFAVSWSLPPLEIIDWINPNFSGILENYWGLNAFKQHTEYFGIIILFFAIAGMIMRWKNRNVRFFTLYTIFGLLMALGGHTPFYRIPYHLFPMISKFRAPALIFFTVSFSFVVLAAYGIGAISNKIRRKEEKKFKYFGYIFLGFLIILLLFVLTKDGFTGAIGNIIRPLIEKSYGSQMANQKIMLLENNYGNIVKGVFTALIFTSIIFILSLFYIKKKLNEKLFYGALGFLIFVDLYIIDKNFIRTVEEPSSYYAKDEVVRVLEKDNTLYRVFPLYYREDDYLMLYKIQSLGGYHGNQLRRYQEFIGAPHTIMFRDFENLFYNNFLNLLNTKYIVVPILPSKIDRYPPNIQIILLKLKKFLSNPSFEKLFTGRKFEIYRNNQNLPRAFMVYNFEVISEDSLILERLKSSEFDPSKTVILEKPPQVKPKITEDIKWRIKIIRYLPNKIEIEAETEVPGFLVLSENWYPFWKVKIDGKEKEVYRAYYTLRAVELSKGKHRIIFYFDSFYFNYGKWITLFSLVGIILYACIEGLKIKRKRS